MKDSKENKSIQRSYWPTDDWQTSAPEAKEMNEDILAKANNYIIRNFSNVNSLLVIRDGFIVYEQYFNGFNEKDLMDMRSVTKSFTSTLVGIAIHEKYLFGVDEKLGDIFTEYISDRTSLVGQTSIEQLLTMCSGFYWQTDRWLVERMSDRLIRSNDWVDFILRLPVNPALKGSFQYKSPDSHLLSAIVAKVTNQEVEQFADKHLFSPLGIRKKTWLTDPKGIPYGACDLKLLSRDMAKLGYLYLNNGVWDNKQIISSSWVEDSTSEKSAGSDSIGTYGYHWWISEERGHKVFFAAGAGGQYICCVPELDIVVVITAKVAARNWKNPRSIICDFVIPSVTG